MTFEITGLILVFFVFSIFGRLIFKNIMNPITIMCGIWAGILFAYSFHMYDLYTASDKSISMIALGVSMFFIGALVACGLNKGGLRYENSLVNDNTIKPDYRVLTAMNILAIICFFGFFVASIRLLRSGHGFNYIARYFGSEEGTVGSSQNGYELMEWYVWPLCLATAPLAAMAFLVDKDTSRPKTWFLITYIITLGVFVVVTGKRTMMICLIVYLIILIGLQRIKIRLKRRTKVLLVVIIAALLFAFNYITVSRGSQSLFRTIYVYFCGCIPCFSSKLANNPVGFKYGLISLHGFYRAPMIILSRFIRYSGFTSIRHMFALVISFTQEPVRIAPSVRYNAFVTPFLYFYTDLGVFGVILFSFLFGLFTTRLYLRYLKDRSYYSLAIYLLITYSLYMSMVRFQFVQMRYVLAFLYLAIPFYRRSRVRFSLKKTE